MAVIDNNDSLRTLFYNLKAIPVSQDQKGIIDQKISKISKCCEEVDKLKETGKMNDDDYNETGCGVMVPANYEELSEENKYNFSQSIISVMKQSTRPIIMILEYLNSLRSVVWYFFTKIQGIIIQVKFWLNPYNLLLPLQMMVAISLIYYLSDTIIQPQLQDLGEATGVLNTTGNVTWADNWKGDVGAKVYDSTPSLRFMTIQELPSKALSYVIDTFFGDLNWNMTDSGNIIVIINNQTKNFTNMYDMIVDVASHKGVNMISAIVEKGIDKGTEKIADVPGNVVSKMLGNFPGFATQDSATSPLAIDSKGGGQDETISFNLWNDNIFNLWIKHLWNIFIKGGESNIMKHKFVEITGMLVENKINSKDALLSLQDIRSGDQQDYIPMNGGSRKRTKSRKLTKSRKRTKSKKRTKSRKRTKSKKRRKSKKRIKSKKRKSNKRKY